MEQRQADTAYMRERAEREIALARATGSKAYASVDWRTVFIERRDGTRETIRIPETKPH